MKTKLILLFFLLIIPFQHSYSQNYDLNSIGIICYCDDEQIIKNNPKFKEKFENGKISKCNSKIENDYQTEKNIVFDDNGIKSPIGFWFLEYNVVEFNFRYEDDFFKSSEIIRYKSFVSPMFFPQLIMFYMKREHPKFEKYEDNYFLYRQTLVLEKQIKINGETITSELRQCGDPINSVDNFGNTLLNIQKSFNTELNNVLNKNKI